MSIQVVRAEVLTSDSGCGKSVMANYLVHRFTRLAQPTFAHFFSLNTEKESADIRSFAISIILQVLKKGLDETLPRFVRIAEKIASTCLPFGNSSQLLFFTLRRMICDAFKELHEYTLIIDGLDECEPSGEPVMNLINDLIAASPEPRPRIIVLSRNSDTLIKLCANSASLSMDESTVMPDIERFIGEKVRQYPELKPIHENILGKTRESCRGHFLWVSTMIEFLHAPANHREERLRRLQSIPDSLMEFYEKLVQRTAKRKANWELRLRREILLLLLNPKRALTIDEIAIALQFRFKKRQAANRRLENISETIKRLCWPLVSIVDERAVFVHTQVEEFITQMARNEVEESLSVHITRAESNAVLASRCLNVLSESKNRDPSRISYWLYKNVYNEFVPDATVFKLREDEILDIVFYEYAARFWDYHLTSVKNPSADLLDLVESFLHNFEFVMYGEYLYNLKGEIGPISEVQAKLRSWWSFLPPKSKERLNLDGFYEDPYSKLAQEYARNDGSKVLKYLCLFRLGDFYALQAMIGKKYETFKEVADGLEAVLGSEEPLTLRAKYFFAACLPNRRELTQALELATKVSDLQKTICGLETKDYWKTLQLVATVQFLMTDFEKAAVTQASVTRGWTVVKSAKRFDIQVGELFSGYIFEARGLLEDALIRYKLVEKTQSEVLGSENVIVLWAQTCVGSAYRKLKNYDEARKNLEHALSERQVLFGEKDQSVVDTTIQLIVLDREVGTPLSLAAARARIGLLKGNGSLDDKFERYCQVEHLDALILRDQGEFEKPRQILRSLLDEQTKKGREANHRSLLWVRLTLAALLRDHEKGDEVSLLFENIVTADVVRGDVSPQFDRLDSPKELRIAEEGLRLVRDGKREEAEKLLREHNLRWVRRADFWLLSGTPSVDTGWMKGP
jgi:tetratricopeptide (TPR) repeat protein